MIVETSDWLLFVSGASVAYVTVVFGWLWKTEIKKCRRCRLRGINCCCLGGPR